MTKSDRILIALFAATGLALRAIAFFRYRVDSDEPQHLHVAWGWTAGYVQYKDVFDNHAPLFHILTAPLLLAVGERADVVLWMRAPMLVLFAIVLACTFVLARRLYDTRTAAWAVVLLAIFPTFFLKSLEYRTDNLWVAFWMLALAALTAGPATPRGMFFAGAIFGCALATSMKTTMLIAALILAAAMAGIRRVPVGNAVAAAAGFLVVPGILAVHFITLGVWNELLYCVFEFNQRLALIRPKPWWNAAAFPLLVAATYFLMRRYVSTSWRSILALWVAMFAFVIGSFWLIVSPRDLLGVLPILAIFAAAYLPRPALAGIALLSVASIYYYADRLENRTDEYITQMNQALGLTRPGEPVMDLKGELVYRPRPFYYPFELITRTQMAAGMIPDTIPEDVVRSRCHVAQADGPVWPPRGRAFLRANFIDLGRLRAAGQWIGGDGTFNIAIPGEYAIVTEHGHARGTLDGTPYTGPRELGAGPHRFVSVETTRVALLWAPAFERGYSPFHLRDREF